jgi:nicotinamidase/pyrazinamidase
MKIFWNVDTQVDFMNSDGKLSVPNAESIKPNLKKLTDFARDNKMLVVSTADWHNHNSKELSKTPDFITTFPEHCMGHDNGAQFIEETTPYDDPFVVNWDNETIHIPTMKGKNNIVIRKDAFDVFSGNRFTETILHNLHPEEVVVYGVAENVCLNFAVMGLVRRGYKVKVVSDAIMGLPNIPSPKEEWMSRGVELVTTDEIVKQLQTT